MEKKFRHVIQDGEHVLYGATASKKAYVLKRMLAPLIILCVLTVLFTILAICLPYHYVGAGWHENGEFYWHDYEGMPFWVPILVFSVLAIVNVIVFVFTTKEAKLYAICVTESRILIRYGVARANYQTFPFDCVTGDAMIVCDQSIFDQADGNDCSVRVSIPSKLYIHFITPSLVDGFDFAKKLERSVNERKSDAPKLNILQ